MGRQLTEHFNEDEFRCKCAENKYREEDGFCGGKSWPDPNLIPMLEALRARLGGKPITINSGCRCPKYNATLPDSAPTSQHILGKAADIVVEGVSPDEVAAEAEKLGFGGVGRYDGFTHVDIRPGRGRWDFRVKKKAARSR